MKTTIATAALMILMTAATVNAASITDTTWKKVPSELAFDATVNLQVNDIIEFRVEKPAGEKVILKLYGKKNNKVYQRTLRKEKGIAVNCDMSQMDKGTYIAVIEREGEEVLRKEITLN